MKIRSMLALGLVMTVTSCLDSPFPCTRYCWSHRQLVPDLTDKDMTGVSDGRFDATCENSSDSQLWYPPLPQFGWYSAERCLPADAHQIIAETVAAIEDPTIDASQACDVTDLRVYADLVLASAIVDERLRKASG